MVFSRGFMGRASGALGSRMYLTLDYCFSEIESAAWSHHSEKNTSRSNTIETNQEKEVD
jgi:hypothetical protein